MNLDLLRETLRGSRNLLTLLLLLALLDAALYSYRAFSQTPELERARSAYSSSREAGGGSATQRTVHYEKSRRDLARFEEKLIAKKEFARFLEELFGMAEKRALSLKGISYKARAEKGEPLVTYAMTLSVAGRYPALKGFIGELSRYPQMVTVDAVTLKNSSPTEEAVELQLQISAFLKTEGA